MTCGGLATSDGYLLDRRVRYAQPVTGYRTGIEPVFLAAAIPARAGEHVLEAGTGAGAAALCLAFRVPGLAVTGVERDPDMVAIARRNVAANGFADRIAIHQADICAAPPNFPWGGPFDHACANPPWHAASGSASPDPRRDAARRGTPGLVLQWTRVLAANLRIGGTLTLILPESGSSHGTAALAAAGCGSIALLPLWPKAGAPARIILLQGRLGTARDSGMADHAGSDVACPFVCPGLVLHPPDGGYTVAAEAVLRSGAALTLSKS